MRLAWPVALLLAFACAGPGGDKDDDDHGRDADSDADSDSDGDGCDASEDGDDADPSANPGAVEQCVSGRDEDRDGDADDRCVVDFSDTWALDTLVAHSCLFGALTVEFDEVEIVDTSPSLTIRSTTGSLPGLV